MTDWREARTAALRRGKYALQDALRARDVEVTRFRSGIRSFELRCLEVLRPASVLDVGANVGQFAARLRRLGYAGDIWSFEPSSAAFAALQRAAASDARLHPVRAAAGPAGGTATLHLSGNSVSSSLLGMQDRHADNDPASRYVGTEVVPVVALDDWAAERGLVGPAWLKVDAQGFEGQVLAGAAEVLSRVDLLRMELSLVPLYDGQDDHLALLQRARELGFEVAYVEPSLEDRRSRELLQLDVCLLSADAAERLRQG